MAKPQTTLEVDGHEVAISNPGKLFFPDLGITKLDLVRYYLDVGDAALRAVHLRPTVLKRYPDGVGGKMFFQHRVPAGAPPWLSTARVTYTNADPAVQLCPTSVAHLAWAVNLGCIDLNPWASRRFDLEHPDELRIDLDPPPELVFADVKRVAGCFREVFDEAGMVSFPKTSGNRGIHIRVPIPARHSFDEVRAAAVAASREVERRLPDLVTIRFLKEERGRRVFVDVNQNARDRTLVSAWSVRPNAKAMVSAPFSWGELDGIELEDVTILTAPERLRAVGDHDAALHEATSSLTPLLDRFARDEAAGLEDFAWLPSFGRGRPRR